MVKFLYLLLLLVAIPVTVYALESDGDYFIDSENTFMIIETSQNGTASILEGGMLIGDDWDSWSAENLKITKITDNGDKGIIFGTTEKENSFYIIYDLDESEIRLKVWHDSTSTRIIEDVSVVSLFE